MSKVAELAPGWAVLARSRGEVLTAEAHSPGLRLGLLGVPPGFNARDAEGWLYDVAGVAHETRGTEVGQKAIPALLHHALTGLLFSHAELWEQAGAPSPCSFALADTVHEVGFGLVGDAEVTLWVDGKPLEPEWMAVRDELGREARACSLPSTHGVRVKILWQRSAADPAAGGAEIEAVWAGARSLEGTSGLTGAKTVFEAGCGANDQRAAAVGSASSAVEANEGLAGVGPASREPGLANEGPTSKGPAREEPASGQVETAVELGALARASGEAAPPAPPMPSEGSAIARWLRRGFSWFSGQRGSPGSEPAARLGAGEPSGAGSAGAEPPSSVGAARDAGPALPEIIPPTPEPAEVTRLAQPALPPSAPPSWQGPTGRIPPSPEPAELTERAAAWSDTSDPHVIALPAPATGVTPPGLAPALPSVAELVPLEGATIPRSEPTGGSPATSAGLEAPLGGAPAAPSVAGSDIAFLAEATTPPAADPAKEGGRAAPATEPFYNVPPQRPAWPSAEQLARTEPQAWRRPWVWLALVAALFAAGWLVGSMQEGGRPRSASNRGTLAGVLQALGLGGPRFAVDVRSRPPGAWIALDGKALALRTPATVHVPPGEHTIGLSFPDLGGASYTVRGAKGDRVPLESTLWGAVEIYSPNVVGVVAVAVDGVARGFAPLRVDSLTPGVHEVRFSGPGMTPWGQTVDIRVGETKDLLARAVQSPATGMLQVQASLTDEQGTQPLTGGQVWIDGEPRGTTPLTLDLPRGPHSVRLAYKGQEAPIQVIDLPGGNQRFAVFEFGLDQDVPRLMVNVATRIPRDHPALISAWLGGLGAPEVREMWLHAQAGEGAWRRYPMTLLKAPTGPVGAAVFPTGAFDRQGRARYYLSAHYGQGNESFTEIRTVQLEGNAVP